MVLNHSPFYFVLLKNPLLKFKAMQKSSPLFLLLVPLIFLLSNCQKSEYVVPNRTIITQLSSGDWVGANGSRNYTAAINVPEIDEYFNERGAILVYVSFGNRTYEQIPQVYNGVSYSYITRPSQIVIEIQSSDGESVITPPGAMTVKIVLIDSD